MPDQKQITFHASRIAQRNPKDPSFFTVHVKAGKFLKLRKPDSPAFTQVIGQIALTFLQKLLPITQSYREQAKL
jgi:hypothetical protein